jgi:hypothetical protein
MVLFQIPEISAIRIITIYVAQGLVFAFFAFLAYKILKRDRKRLNVIFSGFYLSPVIGFFINFIYGPITDVDTVIFLNFLTNFFIFYAPIFLVVFNLILLKSEKVIVKSKQLMILIGYAILMFCMIFFLFIPGWGVEIASPTWSPHWMLPFFIYLVIVESLAVIPSLLLALKIYKKFEDEILKKKWKFFIYGFCALIIFMYGIFVSNFLDIPTFRTIMGLIGLILAIAGGYMLYTGVGKQLEK